MTPHLRANLIGGLLAVVVPLAALLAAAPRPLVAGEVGAPFVWTRLLVVHLLTTLPLALLLAGALARGRRINPWLWAIVGAGLAGLAVATIGPPEDPLGSRRSGGESGLQALRDNPRQSTSQPLGFETKALARVGWCLGLQLPWCLLGWGLAAPVAASARQAARWPAVALAALVAVAPPWIYARGLIDVQSSRVEE
jgi:hypothetical protein